MHWFHGDTKEIAKATGPVFRWLIFDLENPSLGDLVSVPLHHCTYLQHCKHTLGAAHMRFSAHFHSINHSTAPGLSECLASFSCISAHTLIWSALLPSCPQFWKAQTKHCHEPGTDEVTVLAGYLTQRFTRPGGTFSKLTTISLLPKCSGLPSAMFPALLLLHPMPTALPTEAAEPWGRAREEGSEEEHPLHEQQSAPSVRGMKWHYSLNTWPNHFSMYLSHCKHLTQFLRVLMLSALDAGLRLLW